MSSLSSIHEAEASPAIRLVVSPPNPAVPHAGSSALAEFYRIVRGCTEALCDPLACDDYVVQSMPDASLDELRDPAGYVPIDVSGEHLRRSAVHGRIEMHLVSRREQVVRIDGMPFFFAMGESIHTENSYKYSHSALTDLAEAGGFAVEHMWTDDRQVLQRRLSHCKGEGREVTDEARTFGPRPAAARLSQKGALIMPPTTRS